MTEEQKQAHIEAAHKWIEVMHRYIENHPQDISAPITLGLYQIALAALTAQPDDWQQRAEAAEAKLVLVREQRDSELNRNTDLEAKLAELAKQEPVGNFYEDGPGNWWQIGPHDKVPHVTPLFDRPAPAADLAELVPDAAGIHDMDPQSKDVEVVTAIAQCEGWNACRSAMLAKLENHK